MLRAAADAARGTPLQLLAVTILTSLDGAGVAEAWGRDGAVDAGAEAARLASLADGCGIGAVVASVHEVPALHSALPEVRVLCPGIRLAGDAAGDQSRVATPAEAARAGAHWVVLGRSVSAAADPAAAWGRAAQELSATEEP